MMQELHIGDLSVDVVLKNIKNVHLSVYPPTGRVRISAPLHMPLDTIRTYAISRLAWIRKHQRGFRAQERETPREFLNRESHYLFGRRYLLRIVEEEVKSHVELKHSTLVLYVRPGSSLQKMREVLGDFYRQQLRQRVQSLLTLWEKTMGVQVAAVGIKKMRTRWGTCNAGTGRIWLNLELAKKPVECLEYILVHEICHFFERTHNDTFIHLMNRHLPAWRAHRDQLNRLPVSHVEWGY